jgi:hypothetical protein
MTAERKPTNPKDAVGVRKAPMSTVPAPVIAELGVAMLEGARKYGRHNYRAAGVRASVYYDAAFRHLMAWWEGEDVDPDSALSHVTKAIATLVVLRDSMMRGNWTDDRPPRCESWLPALNEATGAVIDRYPNAEAAYTEVETNAYREAAVELPFPGFEVGATCSCRDCARLRRESLDAAPDTVHD